MHYCYTSKLVQYKDADMLRFRHYFGPPTVCIALRRDMDPSACILSYNCPMGMKTSTIHSLIVVLPVLVSKPDFGRYKIVSLLIEFGSR